MIQKAVLSYFNPENTFRNTCGFNDFGDFLYTTALSALCASRQFPEVEMVSDDWGVDIFKEIGLPVTSYSNKLNEMKKVSRHFWAFGKLLAYAKQEVPFLHLDNDVFIWEALPKRILNAELCFQSHEPFTEPGYSYYDLLKPCFNAAPVRPQKIVDNEVTDFAYNCGICGGNNLAFFKEWIECSAEYIFAEENQDVFFREFATLMIHQNLFHEQYFAACLIKMHKMRKKVQVLHPNVNVIPTKYKYTHLWGTTKKDTSMMKKVGLRLQVEDEDLHRRIGKFILKYKV